MDFEYEDMVALPPPSTRGRVSLEEALSRRRSRREFGKRELDEFQLSQLLWSAQGITEDEGARTAPSAGALFALELFVVARDGLHRYEPRGHRLGRLSGRDLRGALSQAALGQRELAEAPLTIVIAAVFERIERKYGHARGERYTVLEAGHAAQNLLLQATALDLASVPIGAFEDAAVREALDLPAECEPIYLVPVGSRR